MTETLSQNTPDITKHSTKDIQATIDATAKKTSLGSVKTLDDAQNVIETAVKKIEWKGVTLSSLSSISFEKNSSVSFIDALHNIDTHPYLPEKVWASLWEKLKEQLKNHDYVKAIATVLQMLFFGDKNLNFSAFHWDAFPTLSTEQKENIYAQNSDETKNTYILELTDKIGTTSDINKKMSYSFVLTQLKDFFLTKQIQQQNPNSKPDDMDLLAPRLTKGSIICMRQERENPDITMRLWDAGMIENDNKTIMDFTHTVIVTETVPEPMITHSTMKEWVHTQPLKEYLKAFEHTNLVVMNPNDPKLGEAVTNTCISKLGMQYDKQAPVAEFLGSVDIKDKLHIQDDKTKTNCVEFIADAITAEDPSYTEIYDKAHPNDMLAIAKKWYTMSYVKTYSRDRVINSERNERIAKTMEHMQPVSAQYVSPSSTE